MGGMSLAERPEHGSNEPTAPTWTFGDRLAKARRLAGLTQAELALRLGVSRKTLVAWEHDATEPQKPLKVTATVAELAGVPQTWLIEGDAKNRCFLPVQGAAEPRLFDPDTLLGWADRAVLTVVGSDLAT